jgi:hypothetical protein
MNTLLIIETNCRHLAALRGQLRKKFEARRNAQNLLDTAHNPGIRDLQEQCQALRATLLGNLAAGRDLFLNRKTQEFHGITVGFEKERDSLTLPPEEILVDRIQKMLPAAQGKTLLDCTVKVIKHAFKKLPLETLQKLGCSVIKGGDKSVVRANDDDIEALVQKSLGSTPPGTPVS